MADAGHIDDDGFEKLDEDAVAAVDIATKFADQSPFPDLDSLYDDIYVYGEQVQAAGTPSTSARPSRTAANASATPA